MLTSSRWIPFIVLLILGAIVAFFAVPIEIATVRERLIAFPESHSFSYGLQPYIAGFLCFMPAIAGFTYACGNTFDRYLSKEFFGIFGICLSSLFSIWILLDLNDNLSDFEGAQNLFYTIIKFYLFRSPAILILLLPYSLLLANIYCLGKLSKSNEIIAMIQSGTGVVRVSTPLILAGLWCSVLLLGLNYHWAPNAEGKRNDMISIARNLPILEAKNVLYRDPNSNRLWMVGGFPADYQVGKPLQHVEITTVRKDRTIKSRMSSPSVKYDRKTRLWTFTTPTISKFTEGESPLFEKYTEDLVIGNWSETPAQIIKPGLDVEYQSIPELTSWLKSPLSNQTTSNPAKYLTQWHYRFALPITCLITVLLAAPLSIHFARRGSGSGIFLAVVLSVLMIFFSTITLAFGEGGILAPMLAAWLPNITFGSIGLYLYHRRIYGQPILQSLRRIITVQD